MSLIPSLQPHPTSVNADVHEIVSGIYLGNFRIASNYTLLRALGITHILNSAIEHPNYFENTGIIYKYLPLQDEPNQDISQYFKDGFEFIDQALRNGGKVLVHCHAGISRSTTMLTSYLMKKYNRSPREILHYIRSIRGIIQPNTGFSTQLLKYHTATSSIPPLLDIFDPPMESIFPFKDDPVSNLS